MIVYSKDRKKYLVDFSYNVLCNDLDDYWSKSKDKACNYDSNELDFIKEIYPFEDLEIIYD